MRSKFALENLTIRTQILIVSLISSSIIFTVLFITILLGEKYILNLVFDGSELLFLKQTQIFMNNIWIYQMGIEELVEQTKQQISSIRELKNFIERQNIKNLSFYIPDPNMCLQNSQEQDQYCFNNSICCGKFGTAKINTNDQNLLKTASLLNEFRLEYDLTQYSPFLLIFKSESQIFCNSNGFPYPSEYKPLERPYYKEHLQNLMQQNNSDEIFFANPYSILRNVIRCSITISLRDSNNVLVGVGAKDLDFDYSQIGNKQDSSNITSYIISLNGTVVYNKKYKIKDIPIFSLNDSQYSGFTSDDYEQIMLQHQRLPFKSNCKQFQSPDFLCLFNSDIQQNVMIQTSNINGSPFIMLIMYNIDELRQEELQHISFVNENLSSIIQQITFTMIFQSIFFIFIGQIATIIILRQLNNIISTIKASIKSQSSINFYSKSHLLNLLTKSSIQDINQIFNFPDSALFNSDEIAYLKQVLVNQSEKITQMRNKSNECQIQEMIEYPKICKPMLKNLILTKFEIATIRKSRTIIHLEDILRITQLKNRYNKDYSSYLNNLPIYNFQQC